jgi:hypothetical protein
VAGKMDAGGIYRISEFAPIGEWKKAAEYLALENELRAFLFFAVVASNYDWRENLNNVSLLGSESRQQLCYCFFCSSLPSSLLLS